MDKDTAIKLRDFVLDKVCSLDKYINMLERKEAGEEVSDLELKQCMEEFSQIYVPLAVLNK